MDEKHTVEGLDFDGTASKGGVAASISTSTAAGGDGGGDTVNPPHVHMDAMAFGMGCCCLQVTFQVGAQGADADAGVALDWGPCDTSRWCPAILRHGMSMLVGDERKRGAKSGTWYKV